LNASYNGMKLLITGGAGYIGSSFQARFGSEYACDSYDTKIHSEDDLFDMDRLTRRIKDVDGILHFGAVARPKWGFDDPYGCLKTNILGTANVVEAVRRANSGAWIIFGSSREVFGDASMPVSEETPRLALNAYGVSKSAGEDILRQYAMNYGLRCLTLRFCGVYTGTQDILDRVVPRFILRAIKNEPIHIEGDGGKKFDFTYIDDAIRGVRCGIEYISAQRQGFYDDITLAAESPITLDDLARMIVRLAKSTSKIEFVPDRTYDQIGFWGVRKKARERIGWEPEVVLEDGLSRAIAELKTL
jgi:nucleoside-diphosphate-sugar epimerase